MSASVSLGAGGSSSGTCGGGGGVSFSSPTVTLAIPCLFTISLPSFTFSFTLPTLSIVLFLEAFFNLSICDLSIAFDISGGVAASAYGGRIVTCVPDPSLSEQTYLLQVAA